MKLISFNQDPTEVVFELNHTTPGRDGTTLTRNITLRQVNGQWVADINLMDIPKCDDPDAAAAKLGEWMYRLSEVIFDNKDKFGKIDLMNIKNS